MAKYEIIDDLTAYVASLEAHLASIVEAAASPDSNNNDKRIKLGVSGGSAVDMTASALEHLHSRGALNKVDIFFCDERVVADDDKESIYGAYSKKNTLTSFSTFHKVNTSLGSVDQVASDYEQNIRNFFKIDSSSSEIPKFDCLILGMGDDGHTCSLFPDYPALKESTKFVTGVTNSPKPPPNRVTMTYPLINAARNVIFLVRGQGKASAVKSILASEGCGLPAGLVRPTNGSLVWLFDKGAASLLPA